jgi:hypothetical protein
MPSDKRVRTNDQQGSGYRGEQPVEPDEEKAIAVREPDPAAQFTPQHDDLLAERCVLRLERQFGPERCG